VYPFPRAAELQFLIGDRIGQIKLDPWSLQFHLVSGTEISVESRIEHVDEAGISHSHDCQVRAGEAIYLHQLIERPITGIEVESLCLSLTFEGGAILRIYSNEGSYECGQIGGFIF
jgi:hypothetical protein